LRIARIGKCGRLSFVSQGDGYSRSTRYFDERGALVAIEQSSDTNSYCDGHAFGATYGAHDACTPVTREDLCPNPPEDDGL